MVERCVVAAKIKESINKVEVLVGGIGGIMGQTPGFTTVFVIVDIFCIEPGAGINGIGN